MQRKISVTKRYTFEAGHNLIDYDGKCANLHGHSYKLEVTFSSDKGLNKQGMVIDFNAVDDIVKPIVNRYDHSYLNDFFDQPTAENMALGIYDEIFYLLPKLSAEIGVNISLSRVRLWETEKCYATVE